MKKYFGSINLTWKKVIIMAICAGVYTALMAMLPITKDTSFRDISIYFEVWILFGIFIIMNSNSPKDSALKCFVFFLISQPLIYLIQVPFSSLGWQLFSYYRYWFIWTLLTIPMAYFGYYMKENKWWGLLILIPMLLLLTYHFGMYLGLVIFFFPHHLLSAIFCFISLLIYPYFIFDNKTIRNTGLIISILLILIMGIYTLSNRHTYSTTLLTNNGELGATFDDTYKAYLEDESHGTVEIEYNTAIEDYVIEADFIKGGKTKLILENSNGKKEIYTLDISYSNYEINKE